MARTILNTPDDGTSLVSALSCLRLDNAPPVNDLLSNLALQGAHFNHEGATLHNGLDVLCRGRVISLDRPMLLIAITDISDLKRSEKRRSEALNFLSHDLRAPLTSVLALIEQNKRRDNDARTSALLAEIERYIQKNLAYAENYIQLSRLAHTEQPRYDDCDAQSLVDNAVAQLYHAAVGRGIRFNLQHPDEDIWLHCNRSLLERALLNLIDNGLKHSADGALLQIAVACDDTLAHFTVKDSGPGIPDADLSVIFDYFRQGSDAQSGTGLGLRFVAAVASTHGGKVIAENHSDGGAIFTLSIPLAS